MTYIKIYFHEIVSQPFKKGCRRFFLFLDNELMVSSKVVLPNFPQFTKRFTAWKMSKYGIISDPYFPVSGLNTEICGVNLRIQSEYRKTQTRNNPYLDTFYAVILRFLNVSLAGLLSFFQKLYFEIVPNSLQSWEIEIFKVSLN